MNAPVLTDEVPRSYNLGFVSEGVTLQKHSSVEDKNIFIPSSIYWGNLDQLYLPYLPYFSNCEGYDSFIPIFSLLEQNS